MRILVIGAGDIGFQLSKRLSYEQHDITIVEEDSKRVQRAREQLDGLVVEGNGASYRVLRTANLQWMELVAAVTDNDEVNLMACRIAKKAGVARTIARVRNIEYTDPGFVLSAAELGADYIIHPEKETAHAVVQLIKQSAATYAVDFEGGRIQVLGLRMESGSPLLHKPLIQLDTYRKSHLRIVALQRNHKTFIPDGQHILLPGDHIYVVCDHDYISEFMELAGLKEKPVVNVMILGGGLIGKFTAQSLARDVNIKIIEGNERRAEKLAEALPHALVIHGDGTDFDLLHNENLADMDAFVALTGDDEMNIITALHARHEKVPRSIALVNKVEYLPVTPTIGLDTVVSKQLLTVNAVQHLIQKEIASIASPPGLEAQLIEYIASDRSKITRRPLKDIHFPRQAIVGAVMRGDEVIIPHGDTQIQPGDKTVIFTMPGCIHQVDRLFGA